MAGFKRVFRSNPGNDVLTNIESVNILDITPPGRLVGAGAGTVLVVGEFERGDFTPREVFGPSDLVTQFGGLGHQTTSHAYDGATARKSGGDELWNGNGFIWLRNKRFSRLVIQRVDNSAGSVQFSRLACLTSTATGPITGVTNGQTIVFERNGSTTVTATVAVNEASIVGSGGTFNTGFSGGETLELRVDQDAPRVVVFTAADQTLANVIDRINSTLAQTVAFDSGGELELRSVIEGRDGRIEIVGGTGAATLGHVTSATQQVSTVTVNSNTGGGAFTIRVVRFVAGVSTQYDRTYTAAGGDTTTQVRDGILGEFTSDPIPGVTAATGAGDTFTLTGDANIVFTPTVQAEPGVGDATIAATTAPRITVDEGDGNLPNVASIELADAVAFLDAAAGISASLNADGFIRACNSGTPATGTLQVTDASTASTAFGFDTSTVADAADGSDVTIPAGTRVQDTSATATIWVTIEDIETGTGGGSWSARVRPWTDTDSAIASTASNVTSILSTLEDGFSVTNSAAITRLSQSQIEARYRSALEATLDQSGDAYQANMVCSARTSESIMRYLKTNALDATRQGMFARKAIVRPPLGTTRATLRGSTGVGVGNTTLSRDERVVYCGIGFTTQIPEIQEVGTQGGTGFTEDGIIEVGSDGFYASVRSILNPEEDAGQRLTDTNVEGMNVLTLEDAYNPKEGGVALTIDDYISFKANGIVAARFDRQSGAIFQSDVTSVNPTSDAVRSPANRRFMADYIIDTLGESGIKYVKKLQSPNRRRAMLTEITGFLRGLQSPNSPETARIDSYSARDVSTKEQREAGIMVIDVAVRMIATIKSLVYRVTVGTTVQIEEAA